MRTAIFERGGFDHIYKNQGRAYLFSKIDEDTVIADFGEMIRLDPNDAFACHNQACALLYPRGTPTPVATPTK